MNVKLTFKTYSFSKNNLMRRVKVYIFISSEIEKIDKLAEKKKYIKEDINK